MEFYKITIKMNEIVNKYFLARDKSMPEMHLKHHESTYRVCGTFSENKERIQKFKEINLVFNKIWLMRNSKI